MGDLYVVLTVDRHADPDVAIFTGEPEAIAYAEREVGLCARHPELIEDDDRQVNDAMRAAGWVWYCRYSADGDSVRVLKRKLN